MVADLAFADRLVMLASSDDRLQLPSWSHFHLDLSPFPEMAFLPVLRFAHLFHDLALSGGVNAHLRDTRLGVDSHRLELLVR
jgi:hypothetical protein